MRKIKFASAAWMLLLFIGCGTKPNSDSDEMLTNSDEDYSEQIQEKDEFAIYDSINKTAVEKTDILTLISGYGGSDGSSIYFLGETGDSLFTRNLPDHIQWSPVDEDSLFYEIEQKHLNKKYKVTYRLQWEPYDPSRQWEQIMAIDKMVLVK